MTRLLARCALPALAAALAIGAAPRADGGAGPPLAHMVFFTLKDHSKESRDRFVASCRKYLTGHEGTVSFSVGVRAEDVEEPVSVQDFDVALHLVFDSKASKEKYLVHPRHKQFGAENREHFARVRVFDSYLTEPGR